MGSSILLHGRNTEVMPAGAPETLERLRQLRSQGIHVRVIDVYPKQPQTQPKKS